MTVPKPSPKGNYGRVQLKAVCSIFNNSNFKVIEKSIFPRTFEALNVKYGYVLYETTISDNVSDPTIFYLADLRDRATVLVDWVSILDKKLDIPS